MVGCSANAASADLQIIARLIRETRPGGSADRLRDRDYASAEVVAPEGPRSAAVPVSGPGQTLFAYTSAAGDRNVRKRRICGLNEGALEQPPRRFGRFDVAVPRPPGVRGEVVLIERGQRLGDRGGDIVCHDP
jgi:hypothetical protein